MGAYGSSRWLEPDNTVPEKKVNKRSNPILIVIDASVLFLSCFIIEALTLSNNADLSAIVILLTFGLVVGLTVGLFRKIRENVTNRMLLLFLALIPNVTVIISVLVS